MKKAGIIIIVIGALITLFAGYSFVTKKKVVEIGKLEITKDEDHLLSWSPLVGAVVVILGGGIYFIGREKS